MLLHSFIYYIFHILDVLLSLIIFLPIYSISSCCYFIVCYQNILLKKYYLFL